MTWYTTKELHPLGAWHEVPELTGRFYDFKFAVQRYVVQSTPRVSLSEATPEEIAQAIKEVSARLPTDYATFAIGADYAYDALGCVPTLTRGDVAARLVRVPSECIDALASVAQARQQSVWAGHHDARKEQYLFPLPWLGQVFKFIGHDMRLHINLEVVK